MKQAPKISYQPKRRGLVNSLIENIPIFEKDKKKRKKANKTSGYYKKNGRKKVYCKIEYRSNQTRKKCGRKKKQRNNSKNKNRKSKQ